VDERVCVCSCLHVCEQEIRKAYRKLAMKYHPDKNPQGRDMFEKVQKAYELLNTARPETATGPDPINVLLMVKTQCILFERHKTLLASYKYAGYPLLLEALKARRVVHRCGCIRCFSRRCVTATEAAASGSLGRVSLLSFASLMVVMRRGVARCGAVRQVPDDGGIVGDRAALLDAATALVHLTCLASPRNAFELIEEQGVEILLSLLTLLVKHGGVSSKTDAKHVQISILGNVLHTLSGLATLPEARARYKAVPHFAEHLSLSLAVTQSPKVMQHSLQVGVPRSLCCCAGVVTVSCCRLPVLVACVAIVGVCLLTRALYAVSWRFVACSALAALPSTRSCRT
jgi:hypothetical protein